MHFAVFQTKMGHERVTRIANNEQNTTNHQHNLFSLRSNTKVKSEDFFKIKNRFNWGKGVKVKYLAKLVCPTKSYVKLESS